MAQPSSNETTRFARSSLCPQCGYAIDSATTADFTHMQPTEGDPTVCLNCGALLAFNTDMTLREPTPQDRQEWKEHLPQDQYDLMLCDRMAILRRGPIPGAVQRGPRA